MLAQKGLAPQDLLEPANETRFRPLYEEYLDLALEYLASGWQYTNMLPSRRFRLRLACAWPILIGVKTLTKLRVERVLGAQQPVKISRQEVKRLMGLTVLALWWPSRWRGLFAKTAAEKA